MWLYRHHTAGDIIDIDHCSGQWRPVSESEKPAGATTLADLPIAGSYEIEDDKRYFTYWVPEGKLVFRTFDGKVIEICQKQADGSILMQDPGMRCTIEPAKYGDGRLRQGMSEMRLVGGNGELLCELVYDAEYYRRLYNSDITDAATVRDLSDWDFFAALQAAFPLFQERSESGRVELTIGNDNTANIGGTVIARDDLIYAESGQACSRTGVWAAVNDLRLGASFNRGDRLPQHNGQDIEWVWSHER